MRDEEEKFYCDDLKWNLNNQIENVEESKLQFDDLKVFNDEIYEKQNCVDQRFCYVNGFPKLKYLNYRTSSCRNVFEIDTTNFIKISKSEVELRWFKNLKTKYMMNYPILFEKAEILLEILTKSYRFPLYLEEASPKFAKKYLSVYQSFDPSTGKIRKYDYLTKDLVGHSRYKEILDKKAYGAIIYRWRFLGSIEEDEYYLGITTEREKDRFAQHIADSIIRYVSQKTMTKKAIVIILALRSIGLTENDFSYYYSKIFNKKYYQMGNITMPLVERCKHLFEREVLEIHKSRRTASLREKQYTEGLIDGIKYKEEGLNEIYGGGGGMGIDLPMYDISMMLAFGYQYQTIVKFLLNFYNLRVSNRQIMKRLSSEFTGDFYHGSRYNANKEFLQPIIGLILYEQFLGKIDENCYLQIINFLKSIFLKEDKLGLKTWFWAFYKGDVELDLISLDSLISEHHKEPFKMWLIKNKRFYGIKESIWINWIIERKPLKEIIMETKLSRKQVKRIRMNLNSAEILHRFQLYITIKFCQLGVSWKKIYEEKLKYTDFNRTDESGNKSGPYFFERMFGLSFQDLNVINFLEIDLSKFSRWNYINFSELSSFYILRTFS